MQQKVDFLIIGSGISGLYLAWLLADDFNVLIVTKEQAFESNTHYAQGGIASVIPNNNITEGPNSDSFQKHIDDTILAGAGLCLAEAVSILVEEGPSHIKKLQELGAQFVQDDIGELNLRREGGHSANRIVHASDFTGREIEKVLLQAVYQKGIRILEQHSAVELITQHHLKVVPNTQQTKTNCFGAYIYDRKSWEIFPIYAQATILATGGAGQVYYHNTNPMVATGDGIALAYRAGAEIANMEFYQFHPTTFYHEKQNNNSFLLTEALRGHGAFLRNQKGERFLVNYDSRRELASRDIISRAIDTELKRSGARHLWLDATHLPSKELKTDFPTIYKYLKNKNYDLHKDWIPIVPAAHYMCGGIYTNLHGQSTINYLYALGETACSGVHGGNRLASNSLLEGLVFAARIAQNLKEISPQEKTNIKAKPWQKQNLHNPDEWIMVRHNFEEIQKIMWNYVGIVRSNQRLLRAQERLKFLQQEIEDYYRRIFVQNKILELRNLTLVACLIVESALKRKESRGLHYNIDYPTQREEPEKFTLLQRS